MRRIVCIGDSITYGQLLDDRNKAWPALIRGYSVTAMGVPGDTTRLALERWPSDVQQQKPTIAIIQFGHNDANRWDSDCGLPRVSLRAYEANLREMAERCERFGTVALFCSLVPSEKNPTHARDVEEYDQSLRDVVRMTRTMLIDVRGPFLRSDERLLMPDGVHLNEAGHRLYADVVQRTLDAWR